MALFSSQLCPWDTTGDSLCRENFRTIDSGGAKLGQPCANEDCIDGTCFRKKDENDGKCRHVLLIGDKGCERNNYICTTGLTCYDNVCLREPPKKYTNADDDSKKNDNTDNTQTYIYILYGFIATMLLLLLIAIIILVLRSQNVSTNI
jgi:hypothetical protein